MLLLLIGSYKCSLSPLLQCAADAVNAQGFTLVWNGKSGHFLIVLPEGGLCFAVLSMVAAIDAYIAAIVWGPFL